MNSNSKARSVPQGLKWISIYCYSATVLLIFLVINYWYSNYINLNKIQVSSSVETFIYGYNYILQILGLSHIGLIAEFSDMMQSGLILYGIIVTFSIIYFTVGKELVHGKWWALTFVKILSILSILIGLFLLIKPISLIFQAIGLLIPVLIFGYVTFSKEVKIFFLKTN